MRLPTNNTVHVWTGRLGADNDQLAAALLLLSTDERKRAYQFHFERDRRRFVCCRAALRRVLSDYLVISPEQVAFRYGKHGKPELDLDAKTEGLSFNLSHSGDWAAIAVTGGPEVGIDIEQMRLLEDLDNLARTSFSACEWDEYQQLPSALCPLAFYVGWTRKEAFLKALGSGLYYSLAEFAVTLGPNQPARLLQIQGDPAAAERWQIHSFEPAHDYAAAVVVARTGDAAINFKFYDLPGIGVGNNESS